MIKAPGADCSGLQSAGHAHERHQSRTGAACPSMPPDLNLPDSVKDFDVFCMLVSLLMYGFLVCVFPSVCWFPCVCVFCSCCGGHDVFIPEVAGW